MPRSIRDRPAAGRTPAGRAGGLALFAAAMVAGAAGAHLAVAVAQGVGARPPRADTPYREAAIFGDALHAVLSRAADRRGPDRLVEAALSGMVAALDPYARYLTADELSRLGEQNVGGYSGIGVEIGAEGRIERTVPGTPAATAGLTAGTVIERIDGSPVRRLGAAEVVGRLRGEPGSRVRLRVARPGEVTAAEVTLTRAWLPLHPVRILALDTVAYIALDHFDDRTGGRLLTAIARLKAEIGRDRLTGFVLDLRGNPGGLVVQAAAVAGAFLGRGEIVRLVGRGPGSVERFALDGPAGDLIGGLPMVVLVDRETASAAEIVAGALQDHRRATVVGTRTYGKGAVQSTFAHPGGRGLHITTAWAVRPSGRRIEGHGIEPDHVVAAEAAAGPRGREPGPARPDPPRPTREDGLRGGVVPDLDLDPARDRQLRAALERIRIAAVERP